MGYCIGGNEMVIAMSCYWPVVHCGLHLALSLSTPTLILRKYLGLLAGEHLGDAAERDLFAAAPRDQLRLEVENSRENNKSKNRVAEKLL